MSLDLSHLSPLDAVAAFRSFPRRYREVFATFEGDDSVAERAMRIGPEGESPVAQLSDTTRTWALLSEALRTVLRTDGAVLHPAVADPARRHWDAEPPSSLEEALVLLGHEADGLADQVAGVSNAKEWNRTGSVAGGPAVTALDLVREAVRVGVDGLAQVRTTLAAV